jgi:uncharacterized protein YndB with AHSA1/START domain
MTEINHQIGVNAQPKAVYDALTKENGLANWWTQETKADTHVGGTIKFRFGGMGPDVKITELTPNHRVSWEVVEGMPEWLGTKISFDIKPDEKQTLILFSHSNWKKATGYSAQCNTKWATYLLSLKEYLEAGKGRPYPNDVAIVHGGCGK